MWIDTDYDNRKGYDSGFLGIEVPLPELSRLVAPGVRDAVVSGLRAVGYAYVSLDLEGFRSGRQNEALSAPLPAALPVVS